MIKVELEGNLVDVQVKGMNTVLDILSKLGISAEEYIALLNGEVVTEHESVSSGDVVKFVRVWSGG